MQSQWKGLLKPSWSFLCQIPGNSSSSAGVCGMLLIWLSAQLFIYWSRLGFHPVHLFSFLSESSGCSDTAVDEKGTPFTLSPEAHMKLPCSMWQQKVPTSQRPSETKSSNTCISYSSQKFFTDSGCEVTTVWLCPKGGKSPWPSCVCTADVLSSLGSTLPVL